MRAPVPCLLALLALAAAPASAREVTLGWDTRLNWDSNPLRSPSDEDPDFSIYTGPDLALRDKGGVLDYALDYRLRYEQFVDLSSVNGFEHFGRGLATWRITPRTRVELEQAASRTRGLNATFLEPVPGIDPVDALAELQIRRTPVVRSVTNARFVHSLSKLWSFESTVDAQIYDYEDDLRASTFSMRGSTQLLRSISPRTLAGFGAAITRQELDDTEQSFGTGTTFFEGFAILSHQITPTFSFSITGGPAWSQPDDLNDESYATRNGVAVDSTGATRLVNPTLCTLPVSGTVPAGAVSLSACPRRLVTITPDNGPPVVFPPAFTGPNVNPNTLSFDSVDLFNDVGEPDGSVTFFGRAALDKYWRNFAASLSYQRRASTSSGTNTSTNLDFAQARLTWSPDRRGWRVEARATWSRQDSATETPANDVLISATPVTVWVDDRGRIFESDPGGATPVTNASRVVGVRTLGFVDAGTQVDTYRFDLRVTRHVNQNLDALASAGWWEQTTEGDFQQERTIEDLRFQLGFTWNFDPVEF